MAKRLKFKNWLSDDSGATAIEYAIMASAMALALVPALAAFSGDVGGVYNRVLGYFSMTGV